jgi:NAD(P)-dependent dehydrogenase (short-subunit alcohol dehydrogenase family)
MAKPSRAADQLVNVKRPGALQSADHGAWSEMKPKQSKVVVITGASAGVGRATALEFARHGYKVALIARNQQRLNDAAAEVGAIGGHALPLVVDVADFAALNAAATHVEDELGPIGVWVNNAMATIFAPVERITPEEFRRATEVIYLGQVYGTMIALARMRPRNRGTIVNVGSALAYRAIPLQSAYCGAKFAVRGFTDALRSELMHDRVKVHLTMVHLPAVNTPQFDWALNKLSRRPQPVPPIFQPEVPARAIMFAALHKRREVWVGMPTFKTILANRVMPGLLDRILATAGYSGQLTAEPKPAGAPANLFHSVPGPFGAHGRFDARARSTRWEFFTGRHRRAIVTALAVVIGGVVSAVALRRG